MRRIDASMNRMTRLLSRSEYKATLGEHMRPINTASINRTALLPYLDNIPQRDLQVAFSSWEIAHCYMNEADCTRHILLASSHINVFLVLILDDHDVIQGHYLLDLNREYGLEE